MRVVGAVDLVLDDQRGGMGEVAADEIQGESSHRVLGGLQLQLDTKGVGQYVGVREQPGGEIEGLVDPDLAKRHVLEPAHLLPTIVRRALTRDVGGMPEGVTHSSEE